MFLRNVEMCTYGNFNDLGRPLLHPEIYRWTRITLKSRAPAFCDEMQIDREEPLSSLCDGLPHGDERLSRVVPSRIIWVDPSRV